MGVVYRYAYLAADFGHPGLLDHNADAGRGFQTGMNQNGKRKMGDHSEPFPDKQARMSLTDPSVDGHD